MRLLHLILLLQLAICTHLNAESLQWISQPAQKELQQILTTHSYSQPTHLNKLEEDYLITYQSFVTALSYGNNSQIDAFFSYYDDFSSNANSKDSKNQLMLSNLNIQKGLLQWMNGQELMGTYSFYKAYQLFKDVDSNESIKFEIEKLHALFLILIDQLPPSLKSSAGFFGLSGNSRKGFQLFNTYIKDTENISGLSEEALILYGYCLLKFRTDEAFDPVGFASYQQVKTTPILAFVAASLFVKQQKGELARTLIDSLPQLDYEKFPMLYYLKGKCLLNALNDDAKKSFNHFLNFYKAEHYKADAHLRLMRLYRLQNDSNEVNRHYDFIQNLKNPTTSLDKQAIYESNELRKKPLAIIKARLLFDDGNLEECLVQLKQLSPKRLDIFYQAEWHYRLGRTYQQLKNYEQAILHYTETTKLTVDDKRYFGPYASIQLCKINMAKGNAKECIKWLQTAEKLNNGQYASDIKHQIEALKQEINK